jgi:hypothetical protein
LRTRGSGKRVKENLVQRAAVKLSQPNHTI